MAATIRKPAVLSPLSFTDSISSNTSCGTRTFTCFDLLFIEPVAITGSPCVRCYSLYAKKNHIQCLTCYSPSNMVNSTLIKARCRNGNAPDCWSSTEASNHKPLSEVTVMADNQSTQTRPEFTWRFLSASERYPTAKPLVIYVNASSEREARDTMPGVTLIFAARLPFHAFQIMEVRHA
ncbi:TPA: host cell division inhibitor Icd-like protein [Klebsiella pneumoniae]|nr:host cell division inhibitor Icd-like protein [Klebsiella pneumoniae]